MNPESKTTCKACTDMLGWIKERAGRISDSNHCGTTPVMAGGELESEPEPRGLKTTPELREFSLLA